ncbi:MAG: TetR/AcrR family transcriptional regulator [Lachnospiraceae bacterium]|nr:TetR/AcrR family transcriptional regulator [Lachnospiraceae bacterium]
MARNKHPEETVNAILAAAARLFSEKGYEKTSIQDIIDATKLSKGAIYHHFASKEEIFIKMCECIGDENGRELGKIRDDRSLNGAQKIKAMYRTALQDANQKKMLKMVSYLLDNPKFLAIHIRSIFEESVPYYIEPILKEGIADGSIQAEHPKEVAEVLIMLSDVWLHPLLRPSAPEEIRARCAVFNQITRQFGFEVMDEELTEAMVEAGIMIQKQHAKE